ncbi:50S ribosomal protein L34 [Mycoplasma mycoides]|nr:50S ribosomal protein L34 [Mycoplasma mycoides]
MKRTWQPSKLKHARVHGFRARMARIPGYRARIRAIYLENLFLFF